MASLRSLAVAFLALAVAASARLPDGRAHANLPRTPRVPVVSPPSGALTDVTGATLPPLNTTYVFDQLIDHTNPALGTFKQRFWTTWQFYEPGELHGCMCRIWVLIPCSHSQAAPSSSSHRAKPTQHVSSQACPRTR